jgi:hypothetical protein
VFINKMSTFKSLTAVSFSIGAGIAEWYKAELRAGRSGIRVPAEAGNFCLYHRVPTQPPIQWVPGTLFLGVKRPDREVDHSPPSSAEVKNAWSYTSTPLMLLRGVVLSKSTGTNLPLPYLTKFRSFLYRTVLNVLNLL